MKRIFNLNGVDFTVCKDIDHDIIISCKDLYSCYDRPSTRKQAIWTDWCNWFMSMNCWRFGVRSYNTSIFTIEAIVYVEEFDSDCYLYITSTRRELSVITALHC